MDFRPYSGKNFVIGASLMLAAIFLYTPTTEYFYYGGGWPFVQIFYVIIYLIGSRYMMKSNVPTLVKVVLSFWWLLAILYLIVAVILDLVNA